jgi:hypothetical protein
MRIPRASLIKPECRSRSWDLPVGWKKKDDNYGEQDGRV